MRAYESGNPDNRTQKEGKQHPFMFMYSFIEIEHCTKNKQELIRGCFQSSVPGHFLSRSSFFVHARGIYAVANKIHHPTSYYRPTAL